MGDGAIRLDKWLWHARLVKTRALAQALIEAGRVRVNRVPAGVVHKAVRPGDTLTVTLPQGVRVVRIVALSERRGPAREAVLLYDDLNAPRSDVEHDTGATLPALDYDR
jgi:ribosome-associated heat shock protein Hsp15